MHAKIRLPIRPPYRVYTRMTAATNAGPEAMTITARLSLSHSRRADGRPHINSGM
jgi:hypothetical protein